MTGGNHTSTSSVGGGGGGGGGGDGSGGDGSHRAILSSGQASSDRLHRNAGGRNSSGGWNVFVLCSWMRYTGYIMVGVVLAIVGLNYYGEGALGGRTVHG